MDGVPGKDAVVPQIVFRFALLFTLVGRDVVAAHALVNGNVDVLHPVGSGIVWITYLDGSIKA